MLPLRNILCPIDFSESSLEALAIAIELGEYFTGKVHVLHVIELQPAPAAFDVLSGAVSVASLHRKELEANIQKSMAEVVEQNSRPTIELSSIIEDGVAAQQIVQSAKDLNADIIVISTHGRTGWRRLVYGSVAEEVVRTACCPVLSTRPTQAESSEVTA